MHVAGSQDSNIGSAAMCFTLTRKGYEGMRKDVERCLRNAHLLKVHLGLKMPDAAEASVAPPGCTMLSTRPSLMS